jgi:hypothetical protein
VRPAVFALLVLAIFAGAIQTARVWGSWQNGITNAEYAACLREIDTPQYGHGP